ncbi:hypothetical protein D3C71_2010930 [compost metagenome]
MRLGRADDRSGHGLLLEHPGQCDLRARQTPALRDFLHNSGNLAVRFFRYRIEQLSEFIGFRPEACLIPIAGQLAAGKRAPGNDADVLGFA